MKMIAILDNRKRQYYIARFYKGESACFYMDTRYPKAAELFSQEEAAAVIAELKVIKAYKKIDFQIRNWGE